MKSEPNLTAMIAEAGRIARFGVVGVAATLTHLAVLISLVKSLGFGDQTGNLLAYLISFLVSFLGHYHFTFRSDADYRRVLPRFLLVTVIGYIASAALIAFFGQFEAIPHVLRLTLAVLAVPAFTYVAHRFLVFRP